MKTRTDSQRGQALAEFALAALVFFALVFGVVDFGRAIYQFNGVSQAAREIARVASVHPGTDFTSTEITAAIDVQKGLIPNLEAPIIKCVDASGAVATPCDFSTNSVIVEIHAPFTGITPGINLLGTFDMKGVSSVQFSREGTTMKARRREEGQILVLFVLALVAMVAMVGLILDGGSTFAQRRGQQNAADLAALAGATVQINGGDTTAVEAKAREVTKANNYDDAAADIDVTVTNTPSAGTVKVDIKAPHQNYFSGVVGQSKWDVAVTATAKVGVPTGIMGSAPIIFSVDAFDASGLPYSDYGCMGTACSDADAFDFEKTQGPGSDAPLAAVNMAWTNLGTGSVSSQDVKGMLDGSAPITRTLTLNEYIGQDNNGVKNTLFNDPSGKLDSVQTALAGQDVVVPIVGSPVAPATTCLDGSHVNGCFRGWALFHVVSAEKNGSGEDGTVTGYFTSGFSRKAIATDLCVSGSAGCVFHGLYGLKLIN